MIKFISAVFGGMIFVIAVIAGIGPQNLNTMSHAIRKNHEYAVASACFIADGSLILLSCAWLSLANSKTIIVLINLAGVIFLTYFLWSKIRTFNQAHELRIAHDMLDKKSSILRALAVTLLNPLVFIDTVVIIGGASTHYIGIYRLAYTIGALLGDFVWIFGLTLISKTFAGKLNRPGVWFVIDIFTILVVGYVLFRMVDFFVHLY